VTAGISRGHKAVLAIDRPAIAGWASSRSVDLLGYLGSGKPKMNGWRYDRIEFE